MNSKYDVIVCGCGSAGFCAAVSAARLGMSVAVVEKYHMPGGILTVLGNNSIDQFNDPFRKGNNMVITGIGWELVLRLYREGFAVIPDMTAAYKEHWQYGVKVNPVATAKIMDDMLLEADVKLYYGQPVVDVSMEGNRIRSITIATKSGLKQLEADLFIDCTGDGDLGYLAGAECVAGNGKGVFQPGTMRIYPAVAADPETVCNAAGFAVSGQDPRILNYGDNENHVTLNCIDSEAVVHAEIEGRRMLFEQMKNGRRIMATAPAVAPREGRRIVGLSVMNAEDYCSGKVFEDSVCYSFWFVDIHRDGEPSYIRYITHGNTPTIRLSSLISRDVSNLMMAGRCVSSDRETNAALRVKASCMAMGQAVGTAAALAVRTVKLPKDVAAAAVKRELAENGAVVPEYNEIPSFEEAMQLR